MNIKSFFFLENIISILKYNPDFSRLLFQATPKASHINFLDWKWMQFFHIFTPGFLIIMYYVLLIKWNTIQLLWKGMKRKMLRKKTIENNARVNWLLDLVAISTDLAFHPLIFILLSHEILTMHRKNWIIKFTFYIILTWS